MNDINEWKKVFPFKRWAEPFLNAYSIVIWNRVDKTTLQSKWDIIQKSKKKKEKEIFSFSYWTTGQAVNQGRIWFQLKAKNQSKVKGVKALTCLQNKLQYK